MRPMRQFARGECVLERLVARRAVSEGGELRTEEALVDLKQQSIASADAEMGQFFERFRRAADREQHQSAVDRVFSRAALPASD